MNLLGEGLGKGGEKSVLLRIRRDGRRFNVRGLSRQRCFKGGR